MEPIGSLADQLLREMLVPKNQTQEITIHHANAPPPPPQPVHVWVCVMAAVICALVAVFALIQASDAKAEVRTERLSREIMSKWTAQEVTAIRSYITTGKLAPMSAPPVQPTQEK